VQPPGPAAQGLPHRACYIGPAENPKRRPAAARSFLGLLHMEVFLQRLEQEHGASVITTAPTVPYTLDLPNDASRDIENPSQARAGRPALSVPRCSAR
jgi:hypothetical protein